jgi:extradiol dioxygenase family protein
MTTSPSLFHLSLPVRDLAAQRDFYVRVLGCRSCRVGEGFEDFEFLGHQLTFHEKPLGLDLSYAVMHFGAVVPEEEFRRLHAALLAAKVNFLVEAHEQAAGTPDARWKMVFVDAAVYALELKCYAEPARAIAAAAAYPET